MQVVKPEIVSTTGSITRTGAATYYDQNGILQTASDGVLRFGYDQETKEFMGLIFENAATNYVLYSENFSNAAWASYFDGATRTPGFLSPTGQLNAYKITPASTGLPPGLVQFGTPPIGILCISLWLRADTEHTVGFGIDDSFGTFAALTTEWKRYSLVVDNSLGTHTDRLFQIIDDGDRAPWYMYGVQLEVAGKETSYVKTTSAPVTRNAEVLTGSGLVYTSAVNTYSEWSSAGVSYTLGQQVSIGTYDNVTAGISVSDSGGGTYQCLVSHVSSGSNGPLQSVTNWVRVGPTNQFAVFDTKVSSQTTATAELTFVFRAGSLDTIALLNLLGSSAAIGVSEVARSNSSLYNVLDRDVRYLAGDQSLDWYSYFFYDADTIKTQAIFTSLISSTDNLVTVRISGAGTVGIGIETTGKVKTLGGTQYGANTGIIDYSRKETDAFGNTSLVVRNYSKRMNAKIYIENANLNSSQRFLYSIRATPVLWIGVSDIQYEEPLVVYGFYKDFSTEISYPSASLCDLSIEGLI